MPTTAIKKKSNDMYFPLPKCWFCRLFATFSFSLPLSLLVMCTFYFAAWMREKYEERCKNECSSKNWKTISNKHNIEIQNMRFYDCEHTMKMKRPKDQKSQQQQQQNMPCAVCTMQLKYIAHECNTVVHINVFFFSSF